MGNVFDQSEKAMAEAANAVANAATTAVAGNQFFRDRDEIFNDFDMLVAVSQGAINDQLSKLSATGAIPNEITLMQSNNNGAFEYSLLDGVEKVPHGSDGKPLNAYLHVKQTPRIQIDKGGTDIQLIVNFVSGEAFLWTGSGPLASLSKYDPSGWEYGIVVSLNLAEIAAAQPNMPPEVKKQIAAFDPSQFSVSMLFADLAAVSDQQFQTATIKTSDDVSHSALSFFMAYYLKELHQRGTPYILGYTAHTAAKAGSTNKIPDAILPSAATFTLVHNTVNPDQSCVVYALATRGCHGLVSGSPVNLPDDWFTAGSAQLMYSPRALLEPLLIKPIFDLLSTNTYAAIRDNITVPPGNDWNTALKETTGGFEVTISDQSYDKDRYQSSFTVWPDSGIIALGGGVMSGSPGFPGQIGNFPGDSGDSASISGADLNVDGHIYVFKKHSVNLGLGSADAWASTTVDWSGKITLGLTSDGSLSIDSQPPVVHQTSDSGENAGASMLGALTGMMSDITNALTLGQDHGVLGSAFSGLLGSVSSPAIGSLGVVLANLSAAAPTTVILPAGDTFKFISVEIDPFGVVSIDMDYRNT